MKMLWSLCSGRGDGVALFVYGAFARLVEKLAALRRKQIQHPLLGAAKPDAFRRDDERPFDQDRMFGDRRENRVIVQIGVVEAEFRKRRRLGAQNAANVQ